jgi:predicted nucleic acid-binding protein
VIEAPFGTVVVDTGVYGAPLTPKGERLTFLYRPLLIGRVAVISYVTVAELRFGAEIAAWGERRLRRLDADLAFAEVVWPDQRLTASYVRLRSWAVRNGHGLAHKEHEADRWIAATAIWLELPLVAHDAIFHNVDGLKLLTRLDG